MPTTSAKGMVTLRCIPVDQPIGVFYIGAMEASDLVAISWADVRRIDPSEEQPSAVTDDGDSPRIIGEDQQVPDLDEPSDETVIRYEDQGFERFLGIQRELSKPRVKEIKQYVQTIDATFPTAILLAISSEHASFDESTSELSVVRHSKVAKIIDGQHRIAGLGELEGTTFHVNVAIFIDMDIQDQGHGIRYH